MPEKISRWPLFLVIAVGVFMSTLDSSMVNIALPSIMREFHSPLTLTEWVVMIYLLTITVSLLFWGNLSDRLGRGRIYACGLLIFAVGSFFCGLSQQIYTLIFWRFGQAVGAAMMMSTGPAIIKEAFPAARLGSKLGLIGMSVSFGLMTGPALGGFLIEYASWRAVFFVTVPIGGLFFLLALFLLPTGRPERPTPPFDLPGSLAWAITVILLILGVTGENANIPLLTGSAVTAILLLRQEFRSLHPFLPCHLFKRKFFSAAVLSALLSFQVLFVVIILVPFYLDRVQNLTASRIGLVMMAIPLAVLVVAPVAGWLSDHLGSRYLSTLGLAVNAATLLWLTGITPQTTPLEVGLRLACLGAGQAMFLSPNSASVLGNVHNAYAGVSAGVLATARNLGMLTGVAMAGEIFSVVFGGMTGGKDMKDFTGGESEAFMTALDAAFFIAAAIALAGVLISWLRGPTADRRRPGR